MRAVETEFDWRVVLGEEARAITLPILGPGSKPTSKDLDTAIRGLNVKLAVAQGQIQGANEIIGSLGARLDAAIATLGSQQNLVIMVLGKLHREIFLMRQSLGLLSLKNKDEAGEVIEHLKRRIEEHEKFLQSVMPEYEDRFPAFSRELEERAMREVAAIQAENRIPTAQPERSLERPKDREFER